MSFVSCFPNTRIWLLVQTPFKLTFFLILFYFLTLQYCIGFAIYQHESTTGIHNFYVLCIAYFTKSNLCEKGDACFKVLIAYWYTPFLQCTSNFNSFWALRMGQWLITPSPALKISSALNCSNVNNQEISTFKCNLYFACHYSWLF